MLVAVTGIVSPLIIVREVESSPCALSIVTTAFVPLTALIANQRPVVVPLLSWLYPLSANDVLPMAIYF